MRVRKEEGASGIIPAQPSDLSVRYRSGTQTEIDDRPVPERSYAGPSCQMVPLGVEPESHKSTQVAIVRQAVWPSCIAFGPRVREGSNLLHHKIIKHRGART